MHNYVIRGPQRVAVSGPSALCGNLRNKVCGMAGLTGWLTILLPSPIMPSTSPLCITLLILLCYSGYCVAFGAGSVPQYPVLQGRAFRHGDIEQILADMLIRAADVGINLVGFAAKEVGKKFNIINIKRTNFGNWLLIPGRGRIC